MVASWMAVYQVDFQMAASWMVAFQIAASWMAAFALQCLQNTLRRNWMLRQPLPFAYWLHKHLVSSFTSLFPIQSIRPLLATSPHYAAPVLLRGHHATLEVTSTPHPHFTASFTDLREHFLLSAVFFTLVSFLLLSRPPWGLHLY